MRNGDNLLTIRCLYGSFAIATLFFSFKISWELFIFRPYAQYALKSWYTLFGDVHKQLFKVACRTEERI